MRTSAHRPFIFWPFKLNFEMAFSQGAIDVLIVIDWLPFAEIPEHDGSAAVLAFGDGALKIAIFDRVIFDLDGETLVGGEVAGALCDGPAFQDAIPGKTEVVVEARSRVLLHDEGQCLSFVRGRLNGAFTSARLGGDVEVAHLAIARQLVFQCLCRIFWASGGLCHALCGLMRSFTRFHQCRPFL